MKHKNQGISKRKKKKNHVLVDLLTYRREHCWKVIWRVGIFNAQQCDTPHRFIIMRQAVCSRVLSSCQGCKEVATRSHVTLKKVHIIRPLDRMRYLALRSKGSQLPHHRSLSIYIYIPCARLYSNAMIDARTGWQADQQRLGAPCEPHCDTNNRHQRSATLYSLVNGTCSPEMH